MSYENYLDAYMNSINLLLHPPSIEADANEWEAFLEIFKEHLDELWIAVQNYHLNTVEDIPEGASEAATSTKSDTDENASKVETDPGQESKDDGNPTSSDENGKVDKIPEADDGSPPAPEESQEATTPGVDEDNIEVLPDNKYEELPEEFIFRGGDYDAGFFDGFEAGMAQHLNDSALKMEDGEDSWNFLLHESTGKRGSTRNATNEEASVVEREEPLQPKPPKIPRLEGTVSNPVVPVSEVPSSPINVTPVLINGHQVSLPANPDYIVEGNRIIVSSQATFSERYNLNTLTAKKIRNQETGQISWNFQFGEGDTIVTILPRAGAEIQDFIIIFSAEGQMQIVVP